MVELSRGNERWLTQLDTDHKKSFLTSATKNRRGPMIFGPLNLLSGIVRLFNTQRWAYRSKRHQAHILSFFSSLKKVQFFAFLIIKVNRSIRIASFRIFSSLLSDL